MKPSKLILSQRLAVSLLLQIAFVALIALPDLDPYRQQVAELTSLPPQYLWIPLLGLMVLVQLPVYRGISKRVVAPLEELVSQTKLGANSIAFKKKSLNAEEDHLKHFIESQSLRAIDLEAEVASLEAEIERISEISHTPPEEIEAMAANVRSAQQAVQDLQAQLANERANAAKIESEKEQIRKRHRQTRLELETLIFETRNFDRSKNASPALQSPAPAGLLERLKTPLSLISNLAWRLAKSWEETPPAEVRERLEEISKQSEEQLALLKSYESELKVGE